MPQDLKALAASQMKASEKLFTGGKEAAVARLLAPGEEVEMFFGGQINGKQALVALTDRRMVAVYGMLGKSDTIDYGAIAQINTGLTKLEIHGAGVHLVVKAVPRKDELVNALQSRRGQGSAPSAPTTASDPAALLSQLAALHASGVLTDVEFSAKKAELLDRM